MSECVANTATDFYCKVALMNFQVDFGNALVGIGTALVAITTLFSVRRNAQSRIAEFRKEWIENLRGHLSEFSGLCLTLTRIEIARRANEDSEHGTNSELVKHFERLYSVQSYIILMLNENETLHQVLERKLKVMATNALDGKSEKAEADKEETRDLPSFKTITRQVLKSEWDRLKNEI